MRIKHACLVCCMPFGTKFGLCPYCAAKLFELREPTERADRDLKIKSLFAWRKDGWPALRSVVKRLKGKDDPEPWLELASWMAHAWELEASPRAVLVPVPSAGRNHALGWGRAISHWTGLPVREALRKVDKGQNKKLTRSQRQRLRFEALPRTRDDKIFTKVVIVDDIITTGATAVAAHQALGRPRNCEVWCLMDRRPWH